MFDKILNELSAMARNSVNKTGASRLRSISQILGEIAVAEREELVFSTDGVNRLWRFCSDELVAGRGPQIVGDLIQSARFFDEEKNSFRAAAALFTLAQHLAGIIAETDIEMGRALLEKTNAVAKTFKSFRGDQSVLQVLDTGVRPVGTTAASPLARFSLQVPEKKMDDKS